MATTTTTTTMTAAAAPIVLAVVLPLLSLAVDSGSPVDSLESTLNRCCNIGKLWYTDKRSCNITLSFPLLNVALEHNTMCLSTVGACCLDSLRKQRCDEGKQTGLENGICNGNIQQGKNQVDFMMCCEICKIGVAVGLTNTVCQSTPLFYNHQWDSVYQSCCIANAKIRSISTEKHKKYNFPGHPRQTALSSISVAPENLFKPKKNQNCGIGYAYSEYELKCKDIDECAQRPCDINESCENTVGSYQCDCKSGFRRDEVTNACTDINECQLNLHSCLESQRCDNTVGSYQCVRFTGCGTGYTLDVESALCMDDDECVLKTDTCGALGPDWVCRNTLGSFRCVKKRCVGPNCKVQRGAIANNAVQSVTKCLRGYETDKNNKCTDINECRMVNKCLKNEICINTNGSYYCVKNYQP